MDTLSSAPAEPGSPKKRRESLDAQKVLRLLGKALAPLGFTRTKPSFFTRPGDLVVEFIHIHKYTFGPTFRLHLGIRVLNDAKEDGMHLNGPQIDGVLNAATSRYTARFEYGQDAESIAACAALMAETVRLQAEPWFASMRPARQLLESTKSPLSRQSKDALRIAMSGTFNAEAIAISRSRLGLTA
jgi:hypothetical protein